MAATQFSGATVASHHAPYRSHAYTKSTGYSPTNTTSNTPINVSPTSPRTSTHLPLQRHQGIYQPRVAIGVPAALRKTERPVSKSPPKVDSGVGSPSSGWNFNSALSQSATDGNARPLSQVGNEDMHSIYNDYPMSPTAGPITRNHWQVCYCFLPLCFLMPLLALLPSFLSRACSELSARSYVHPREWIPFSAAWSSQLPPPTPPACRALRHAASQHEDRCNLSGLSASTTPSRWSSIDRHV